MGLGHGEVQIPHGKLLPRDAPGGVVGYIHADFPAGQYGVFPKQGRPPQRKAPALWHSTRSSMPRSTIILRKMPSAMGLRQVLPVQTNKIFIDVQTLLLPAGDNKPPAPFILFSQKRRAPPPDAPLWAPLVLLPGGKGTAFWGFPRPRRLGRVSPVSHKYCSTFFRIFRYEIINPAFFRAAKGAAACWQQPLFYHDARFYRATMLTSLPGT